MSSSNLNPPNMEDMEDPVLSPHFLSPGEDTSSGSSSNSSSQHSDSPRNDWMLQGSIWNQLSDPKSQTLDEVNLNMSLNFPSSLSQQQWSSMDIDADISAFMTDPLQHFSLDPNSLRLGDTVFNESAQEQIPPPENYDAMFQFTLLQPTDAPPASTAPLQLPTPKPSSMSSRSVSPASSKPDSESSAGVNPNDLNLFTQLGHKARDAAGVTLAVPVGRDSRGATDSQTPVTPVSPVPLGTWDELVHFIDFDLWQTRKYHRPRFLFHVCDQLLQLLQSHRFSWHHSLHLPVLSMHHPLHLCHRTMC
jgi:hypothetical protein